MRGEVELARGDVGGAAALLEQAFARACQLGDPCWEGMAARGLALVADANGDSATAFEILADARRRANRLADPYVWLDGYILDAQCTLGLPTWAPRDGSLGRSTERARLAQRHARAEGASTAARCGV